VSERPTVLLDVDGTLVDSNYQHAIAWHRAFREHGYRAAIWELHRHVGMGGDQFIKALLGEEAEDGDGDELRDAHSEAYSKLIGEVEAIAGATTSADADRSKPHPELVRVALDKFGSGGPALMIGDSTWDVKAAAAVEVPTLALLTGGFSEAELREAGAAEVAKSVAKLREGGVGSILALAGTAKP
jgi:phosphoglycolate phosphatase-like HAD superfamily hydrolase